MESEGVKDAKRNENDASEQCKIEIKTENEPGKDWDEIKSDYKLINNLIVSDAIEIKSEIFEEAPMINYGEINNDFTENREKKKKRTDFRLSEVKNGTVKRGAEKTYYGTSNRHLRKKRLRNMKKRETEMNQPSTSNEVVFEACEDKIKSEHKPDINSDQKNQEDVAELSFEFIDCEEPVGLTDSPLTDNDENTLSVSPHKCEPCNKYYSTKKSLAQHVRLHNGRRDYKCKVCGKKFSKTSGLKDHMMVHTDERPFQCDVCNKKFRTKGNVMVHLRSHSGEKPFECETCNKKFSQKFNLVHHARTHSGEKPFQCDICDEKFTVKVSLVRHMALHSGDEPFKCDLCSKTFTQHCNYVKHSRIHTGEKPYKCDFCSKSFGVKSSLTTHVRVHTGEKPYECNFCEKKFSEKYSLTKHIRMHTGERPYKCDICDKDFSRRQGLVLHLRTQHDNKQNS